MAEKRWPTGLEPHGNGIRVRIWKHGKLFYSETLAGNPYKKADLTAATKYRGELKQRLALGLPLHTGDTDITNEFMGNLAQTFLETLDADWSTLLSYKSALDKYWLPAFNRHLITDIRISDIKKVLRKAPVCNKTKKNILIPLRGVFTMAMDDGMITNNPVAAIRIKKHQKPKIQRFTLKEREAILNASSGQTLVYFAILFGCGMRPGEILALKWEDLEGEKFHVHKSIVRRQLKSTTKNHEARRVFIPTRTRQIIKEHTTRWKKSYILLNTIDGPHLDTDVFNKQWQATLAALKIPYRIPYTCRHTRAAELLSAGVEPGKAAKQMGHTLEMFYRTYAEWIDDYTDKDDKHKLEGKLVSGEGW